MNVAMVRLESVAGNIILGVKWAFRFCSWITKFWLNVDNSTAASNVAVADGSS